MRRGLSGTDSQALLVATENKVVSMTAAIEEPKCIAFLAFSVL